MNLVQDGRTPVQLGHLIGALDHALSPDERREVDDGVSGEKLLPYALDQRGGNDIQLQSHGAPGFQSRMT